jgi:threonylcarbamoyladenosine tRNA methylthiotransferase MtaB
VIVGFPGETEADFQATLDTCRAAGFSKIHSFPFSPRRGTQAAEMPGRVPGDVQAERSHRLGELEAELRRNYFRSLVGRTEWVLVEGLSEQNESHMAGTSGRYAPVEVSSNAIPAGALCSIRLERACASHIIGNPELESI